MNPTNEQIAEKWADKYTFREVGLSPSLYGHIFDAITEAVQPLQREIESTNMALKASCQCAEEYKLQLERAQKALAEATRHKSITEMASTHHNLAEYLAQLENQLAEAEKDKVRLDWSFKHSDQFNSIVGYPGIESDRRKRLDSAMQKEQV